MKFDWYAFLSNVLRNILRCFFVWVTWVIWVNWFKWLLNNHLELIIVLCCLILELCANIGLWYILFEDCLDLSSKVVRFSNEIDQNFLFTLVNWRTSHEDHGILGKQPNFLRKVCLELMNTYLKLRESSEFVLFIFKDLLALLKNIFELVYAVEQLTFIDVLFHFSYVNPKQGQIAASQSKGEFQSMVIFKNFPRHFGCFQSILYVYFIGLNKLYAHLCILFVELKENRDKN